jgi:hypothetical protein
LNDIHRDCFIYFSICFISASLKHSFHHRLAAQWEFLKHPQDLDIIGQNLSRQRIRMVLHRDKEGKCRDVTYIDSENKCVYTGEELGWRCNAAAIQKVMNAQKAFVVEQSLQQSQQQSKEQRPRPRHYLG